MVGRALLTLVVECWGDLCNGNYYWNALNPYSGQVINVTANRDDGVAQQRHYFQDRSGINVGNGSSLSLRPTNNVLLDTYAQVFGSSTNPTPFVFSNIPNGNTTWRCMVVWVIGWIVPSSSRFSPTGWLPELPP